MIEARSLSKRYGATTAVDDLSFDEPKTDRGRRSIPLAQQTIATPCSGRANQAADRLRWGSRSHDGDALTDTGGGRLAFADGAAVLHEGDGRL